MNAHVPIAAAVTATPAWFADICDRRAQLYVEGVLDLHEAVDELEAYARLTGLNRRIGRDTVQHLMAVAFGAPDPALEVERLIYVRAAEIVERWGLADTRDACRHMGEAPPKPSRPQASVDAFWLKLWKAKRC